MKKEQLQQSMNNGQYGVITDQNGLYYMWARYYNVSIKRFLNRDTVTGNIGDSPSLNHYAYAQGNAINQNDPFGLSPDINWGAIVSVLSNVAHTALGVLGMIPGLEGMALANGILYMGEGNFRGALGSLISGFPAVGSLLGKVAKGTKFATNTSKVQKLLNVTTRLYDIGKASTDVVGNVKEMVQDYVIEKKPIDLEFGSKAIKAGLSAVVVGANIRSLSGLLNGRKLGKLRGLKKAGGTEKEARKVAGGNGDFYEKSDEIPKLGSPSNAETRRWYLDQEARIPDIIDKSKTLDQQARQAFEFRNKIRTQARDAMADRVLAEKLFGTRPNMTWKQIVEKYTKRGLSGDQLYQEIIEASQRSNKAVNEVLNIFPK